MKGITIIVKVIQWIHCLEHITKLDHFYPLYISSIFFQNLAAFLIYIRSNAIVTVRYHKFVAGKMGIIESCKTAQKDMVD
jgi:hypothetical protein